MIPDLWVEKFRPQTLDDFVWTSPPTRRMVGQWVCEGTVPHLLLSGKPGTGKTSLALLLLHLFGVPDEDRLIINASRVRGVDDVQEKLEGFVCYRPLGPSQMKYVLLDEADRLSPHAQDLLRAEMENYASICRFILTCNAPQKITPALHSRTTHLSFEAVDKDAFVVRLCDVLLREGVTFEPDVLWAYVERSYPDLRKAIGMLQAGTQDGTLTPPRAEDQAAPDWLIDALAMFQAGRHLDARRLILSQAREETYPDVYRFCYDNLGFFGVDENQQDRALLTVAEHLQRHTTAPDPEINLAACMMRLARIARAQPDA